MKHSKEPWNLTSNHGNMVLTAADGYDILAISEDCGDAKRIVACVNACEGIKKPKAVPGLLQACQMLVDAYDGSMGESVDWEDLDAAYAVAKKALRGLN